MRTNIVIDDTLMNDALEPTGCKTKRETVELDLKTLLCLKETRADKGFKGKLSWESDLEAIRTD